MSEGVSYSISKVLVACDDLMIARMMSAIFTEPQSTNRATG